MLEDMLWLSWNVFILLFWDILKSTSVKHLQGISRFRYLLKHQMYEIKHTKTQDCYRRISVVKRSPCASMKIIKNIPELKEEYQDLMKIWKAEKERQHFKNISVKAFVLHSLACGNTGSLRPESGRNFQK